MPICPDPLGRVRRAPARVARAGAPDRPGRRSRSSRAWGTRTCRANGSRRTFRVASSASRSSRHPSWVTRRRTSAPDYPRAVRSGTSSRLPSSAISANMSFMEPMTDQKPEDIRGLPRRRAVRPKVKAEQKTASDEAALALARRIVDLASDKKAADIVLLEIGGLTTVADYFVICSGSSERQLGAIADGIAGGLRDEGMRPIGREGSASAHWMLLDFGSVIVHVMAAARARLLPARATVGGRADPASTASRTQGGGEPVPLGRVGVHRIVPSVPAWLALGMDVRSAIRKLFNSRFDATFRLQDGEREVLLWPSREPVREVPAAVPRSRPDRAAVRARRTLHLRDRDRRRALMVGAGLLPSN